MPYGKQYETLHQPVLHALDAVRRHLGVGGHLVLAGILKRQADELKAAYSPHLQLAVADAEDGWILMVAQA